MTNTCGICDGPLALYGRHGWRHPEAGATPHRAVLGTPGPPLAAVQVVPEPEAEPEPPPERATEVDLDTLPTAPRHMAAIGVNYGWDVLARANTTSISLCCKRGRETIVGLWVGGKFQFSMGPGIKLNASEMKGRLMSDATCDNCGEQVTMHGEECDLL